MDAIILAAGKGERIKKSHNDPKILLELGGITLLERHLKNLESCGVKNVHICCGYKYEKVIQKIKTSEKLNLSVVGYAPCFSISCIQVVENAGAQ